MLISQLAEATGESPQTLRFYENTGLLLEPPRTRGRYRDYPETAIDRVRLIRSLQCADLRLSDIASVTRVLDRPREPRSTDLDVLTATMARIDTHLETLHRMRSDLTELGSPSTDRPHNATP